MTLGVVTDLQCQPAFEGLDVRDPGLRLDPRAPRSRDSAGDLGVPGAKVAFDRQGDLGAPSQAWIKSHAEPFEQRDLSAITDRIACRKRPNAEIEADHGAPRPDLREVHPLDGAAFESEELRSGCTGRRGAFPQAETTADASVAVITSDAPESFPRPPATAIGWTLPRSHCPAVWSAVIYPGFATPSPGLCSVGWHKGPAAPPIGARQGCSAVVWVVGRNTWPLSPQFRQLAGRLLRHA